MNLASILKLKPNDAIKDIRTDKCYLINYVDTDSDSGYLRYISVLRGLGDSGRFEPYEIKYLRKLK